MVDLAAVEYATERLIVAKHEFTTHAYEPMLHEVGDDWQDEFLRRLTALREAHLAKAMAEMGLPAR
jgi:hypothetical protein